MAQDIVIVDDDPDAREILELVLGTLEIPIRQASDGVEALELIFADPPLLVMLDLSMPRLDGHAVLDRLRADPSTNDIPVYVFTAGRITDGMADELHLPPSRLLRKGDLSMTRLREAVMSHLSGDIPVDPSLL